MAPNEVLISFDPTADHLKYRINDMNPRMNLSPQIAAMVATLSTNMMLIGKGKWPHSIKPPARIAPKMNLKRIVTITSHDGQ